MERGVDRHRPDGVDDERVTVGRCAHDKFSADVAAAAGLVVNDEGLLELVGQLLADAALNHVGAAAGSEGDDHAHGFAGVCGGLRLRMSAR